MVGTHSLGFLLAPVAPQVLGAHGFPWVLVFQLPHHHLGDLEGPGTEVDGRVKCQNSDLLLFQCVIAMHSISITFSQFIIDCNLKRKSTDVL